MPADGKNLVQSGCTQARCRPHGNEATCPGRQRCPSNLPIRVIPQRPSFVHRYSLVSNAAHLTIGGQFLDTWLQSLWGLHARLPLLRMLLESLLLTWCCAHAPAAWCLRLMLACYYAPTPAPRMLLCAHAAVHPRLLLRMHMRSACARFPRLLMKTLAT